MKFFKIIWLNIPKLFKKLMFPSVFVISLLTHLVNNYVSDVPNKLSIDALFDIFIFFFIISLLSVLTGYLVSLHLITIKKISGESSKNKDDNLKKITPEFELKVLNYGEVEWTVLIRRRWKPDEIAGVENFLKAIELSDARCGICNSDFYVEHSHYKCINGDCKNNQSIYSTDLYKYAKQALAKFNGDVRNNYDKFWQKYIDIYQGLTNGKYDKYWDVVY